MNRSVTNPGVVVKSYITNYTILYTAYVLKKYTWKVV